MMSDYEPDSGFNLPPGLFENHPYFNTEPRTCAMCFHCLEECCDYGVCRHRLDDRKPGDFEDWDAVLDYLDGNRVDMQEDSCAHWKEI